MCLSWKWRCFLFTFQRDISKRQHKFHKECRNWMNELAFKKWNAAHKKSLMHLKRGPAFHNNTSSKIAHRINFGNTLQTTIIVAMKRWIFCCSPALKVMMKQVTSPFIWKQCTYYTLCSDSPSSRNLWNMLSHSVAAVEKLYG